MAGASGPNFPIPENPVYNPIIPSIANTDRVNAAEVLNPLLEQMIGNTAAAYQAAQAGGNLNRKAITAPIVSHDDVTKTSTVSASEANMSAWMSLSVGPGPATSNGCVGGNMHHVDWSVDYSREAAKHLDVSAIQLLGGSPILFAVLQSSSQKPGDGGFTATFLLQDGTYNLTIEIDATPDQDYDGQLQFIIDWTITNNGDNSFNSHISGIVGITVMEHTVTNHGLEVHFDFGDEAFGVFDDFELEAYASAADAGVEEDITFKGTIVSAMRSNQTVVTFYADGEDGWGVFALLPPLVVPTEWRTPSIATLSFFDRNMSGSEIWNMVKAVADCMVITSAIKNEVEGTP